MRYFAALGIAGMVASVSLAFGATAMAPSGARAISDLDRQFVMKASQDSTAEVQLGKLAMKHGASDAVKKFGQHMVKDHSMANSELTRVARSKKMSVPKSVNAEQKAMAMHLARLNGAAFDEAYAKHMVEDHEKAVALFQKQSSEGQDPALKAWATKTLPKLEGHLQMARSLPGSNGGAGQ